MISRRNALKGIGLASVAAAIGVKFGTNVVRAQSNPTLGSVFITRRGPVTLHTYVAPDASAQVTSHIIETPNRLVVVDTQFVQVFAQDLRAYVDSIGKPIERVILSHEHGDHWAGATQFTDVPFASTETIAQTVETNLPTYLQLMESVIGAENMPETPNLPEGTLTAESEQIDGIAFEYRVDDNAEAVQHLSIHLPEANVWIVQDLIYNNAHFFPGVDRTNWIATLESLGSDTTNDDLLLVGHGLPTTRGEVQSAIAYLQLADELAADATNGASVIAALQEAYPTYGGGELLGFWSVFLG
jgi:glyoxylase-like metal-dependent hydrolase (beta-lactamase superfamily II)